MTDPLKIARERVEWCALDHGPACKENACVVARALIEMHARVADLELFAKACIGGRVIVDTGENTIKLRGGPNEGPWKWGYWLSYNTDRALPALTPEARDALRKAME